MSVFDRVGWFAIVLFVAFKAAVLGALAWETITGHPHAMAAVFDPMR